MGSKGNTATTQNQTSTYQPNPQAAGYIQNALQRADQTSQLPFSVPQAPVAGFSQDQQSAFNTVRNAQGMAQPYINQAANYFSPDGAQSFLNPYASNVMAGLKDVFGQQQAQTTGQLTQAAGGVGADRIAVGQSELAKQQGLAAGQTLSGLYGNAVQQAQSAGYGTAALGAQAQNAALSGAQAQLGTGGLQQQLQQAQLNSPYQLALARAAFPYQQSQFLSGQVGALAPGLGGTTNGTGTTTPPAPSMLSQILGLGTAGIGAAGGFGMFNPTSGSNPKGSSPSYGGGNFWSGDSYGGSGSNPLPGLSASDYGSGFSRGGAAGPHDLEMKKSDDGSYGYDEGGVVDSPYDLPTNVNDKPINIDQQSIVPTGQIPAIRPQIPSLNLNPPQKSGGSGGGDASQAIGTAMKMAMMFMSTGGKVKNPYAYADGGIAFDDRWNGLGGGDDSDVVNPGNPIRMPDRAAVEDWRRNTPMPTVAYAGDDRPSAPPKKSEDFTARAELPSIEASSPYSAAPERVAPSNDDTPARRDAGFAGSPWAALTAAGLGMAAGTSPYAMTNIAQGGLQGLKTLESQRTASQKDETIDQAARRLQQEAKFHEDQYSRMTPGQKATVGIHERELALKEMQPVKVGTDLLGRDIYARKDRGTGQYINIMTGKPVDVTDDKPTFTLPDGSRVSPQSELPPNAAHASGEVSAGARPEFLQTLDPAIAAQVKAVAEGRRALNPRSKEDQALMRLVGQYDPSFDLVNYNSRSKSRQDFTSGKSAQNITSFNTAIGHLGSLDKAIDELNNGDYPWKNKISNELANQTGDKRFQAARSTFQNSKTAVTEELTRAFRGTGGNVHDIIEWNKSLDEAQSPAALHAAVKSAIDLLKSRIEAVGDQYNRGMGTTKDPIELLSPKARKAIQALEEGAPVSGSTSPTQPATDPATPKVGERKQFKQGWGVWNGNSWVPE